jgi:serine/threonine protein kinase
LTANSQPPGDDEERTVMPQAAEPGLSAPAITSSSQQNGLAVGTRLGEFEITGLVGEGGFGIVYLGYDHSLERTIAIKEYMPSALAERVNDTAVVVKSSRHQDTFNAGLKSFINEARLLARFDHPALLKVYRFWEANGTAYMAMPFYEGPTLKQALAERTDAPDEKWLKALLAPLLDALEVMHQTQCFHRDIAPDNILLLKGNRPLLLDFGAARRVIGDMNETGLCAVGAVRRKSVDAARCMDRSVRPCRRRLFRDHATAAGTSTGAHAHRSARAARAGCDRSLQR